jgi:oligosaccharide repeat unit polymerase
MFSPLKIFLSLWITQVVLHLLIPAEFYPLAPITWIIIFLAIATFTLGSGTYAVFNQTITLNPKNHSIRLPSQPSSPTWIARIFLVFYVPAALWAGWQLAQALELTSITSQGLESIRLQVIEDFSGERKLQRYFRVFQLGVCFCIYFCLANFQLSKRMVWIFASIATLSALATTGRLYLLLLTVAMTIGLYRKGLLGRIGVFWIALGFSMLFLTQAIAFNKGDASSIPESILWNLQVYGMSSIACFNDFVVTSDQHIAGGAILPNQIRTLLSAIGLNLAPKPALLPFTEIPIQCNTYTFLFPLYHDAGVLGVCIGSTLLGFFHQALYKRSFDNGEWLYFYSVSVYALAMSIFEDAYFSSPGFWLLLIVPPALTFLAKRFSIVTTRASKPIQQP